MKFYDEIVKARLEQIAGAVASSVKGLIYFRTDTDRPVLDDGSVVSQLMLEPHLPEARRALKVQLDALGTGLEVSGTLPYTLGGTGINSLVGQAGNILVVNALETGFDIVALGDSNVDTVYSGVIDLSTDTITTGAFRELVADIGVVPGKQLFIFVQTGDPVYIYSGAIGSEVLELVLPSGGHSSPVGLALPANARITAKSYSETINSGIMTVNVLG